MSKETEKLFRELHKYIDAHSGEADSEAEMEQLINRFMSEYNASLDEREAPAEPETADDYLELAEEATTKKKQLEYINKALELEPDNLDAGMQKIALTAKHPHEILEALEQLRKRGNDLMEKAGHFRDSMGEFWLVYETRPYMRVCYAYMEALLSCGMMRKAAAEGERLLELCENDNLGVRYPLIHLYAYFEDEAAALALWKKYDQYEETQMLLPMAVLTYKLGRLDESLHYLKRLQKINKGTKKFLGAVSRDRLYYIDERSGYGYRPNTTDELIEELESCDYLFETVPAFFRWAEKKLKSNA